MLIVIAVVLGAVALLAVALAVSYNRFVRQRNLVRESWRQIDVQLQRRHDLIPNLVETVRAYAVQERQVLESVIAARAKAVGSTGNPARAALVEGAVQTGLGRLLATAEAYPELRSDENFLDLQRQLADTEDRIAAGRRFYNGNVRGLNTRVEAFPSAMVASMFHFRAADYFEVDDAAVRAPVAVDLAGIGHERGTVPPDTA